MKKIYQKLINLIETNQSSWINLAILSFIALFIKQYCTYLTYKNLSYWFKYYLNSFCTDLMVVLIILCLTTINQFITNRKIKILNNIISFVVFVVFCIDIFTIYFLQNRVAVPEMFKFMSNGWSWFTHLVFCIVFVIAFLWILLLMFTIKIKKDSKIMKIILSFLLILLSLISVIFSKPSEIDNIISLNINYIKEKTSEIWEKDNIYYDIDKVHEYQDFIKTVEWKRNDVNIILVFAESISVIDSANMWWNDNMTWFDEIQNNWITFANFITNWTVSDSAHIATLLWVLPLQSMRSDNSPYSGYKLIMEPLPEFLNNQWYTTTFLSAAGLDFLGQREFLSWAWFQKIIWEEEFENKKKYAFDSAPDWDLYERTLQEVKNQTGKYFIWLQTISYHKPYDTPLGKTEAQALQYSDGELYKFYQWLDEIWFFDNWILIIVWDHRKMNAAEEWEQEMFGKNWYTRSVATVLWTWIIPGVINENIIQHFDIYNSIKRWVWSGDIEVDETYNDIFVNETGRVWWITNSSFYIENWYTVSTLNWETTMFKNLSNLSPDNIVYEYFSAYMWFEFWIDKKSRVETKKTNNGTIIIWHRWSIEKSPENTLESFLQANELWADWIEFDVSYTKDHQNLVVHWDLLYASNCKNKKVWNYNLEWIQDNCMIINGETYTTLEKMLELIDWLFDYYFLEIKVYDESLWEQQALDAIQTVKDLNMQDRVIFISYSDAARKAFSEDPDIIFWWDTYAMSDLDFIGENNSKYFLAPYDLLTPEIVQKAKDLWKEVVTYTVNDTWDFQSVKDLWVNTILTDKIQLLREYEKKIIEDEIKNKPGYFIWNPGLIYVNRYSINY